MQNYVFLMNICAGGKLACRQGKIFLKYKYLIINYLYLFANVLKIKNEANICNIVSFTLILRNNVANSLF